MCTTTYNLHTCLHALHIATNPCPSISSYSEPSPNCIITQTHISHPTTCPTCLRSSRYLAPPHLDTSASALSFANRRAKTNPWNLEEAQYWILGSECLLGAIKIIDERREGRRSQGQAGSQQQEMSVDDAMCVAKCRYHISRLAEEKDGLMMNALLDVETLMRDPRLQPHGGSGGSGDA